MSAHAFILLKFHMSRSLWKIPHYNPEKTDRKADNLIMKIVLISPLSSVGVGTPGSLVHTLRLSDLGNLRESNNIGRVGETLMRHVLKCLYWKVLGLKTWI